jgi:hypothetical protein
MSSDPDLRARIPADVDAPDKIMFSLTARQVAILAAATAVFWLAWHSLATVVPLPVFGLAMIPYAGITVAVALGRRDGLSLDRWLLAAIMHRRAPHRLTPAGATPPPVWAPTPTGRPPLPIPAPLNLPADAISADGTITTSTNTGTGTAVALVATSTVNIDLRTTDEQAALIGGYARWLNSLTGPVQVVISTRRADLTGHAIRIIDTAQTLTHPALADAALDYADFLLDIAEQRDPLQRTITIALTATGPAAAAEAHRAADQCAASLSTLGGSTVVLDGPTTTAVLTTATDPYQYTDASWARTTPDTPVHAEGGRR